MVVAQLLLMQEVYSLNRVIGKIYIEHLFTANCFKKTKIKKKRPRIAHFDKNSQGAITMELCCRSYNHEAP